MFRGLLVWLIIMVLETGHGVLRGLFLVPWLGEAAAGRIGWPIGVVIVMATAVIMARWVGLRDTAPLLRLGLAWLALTFGFEVAIGLLRGFDGARIWAEVNPLAGGLMVYSLAVMVVAPLLAARLRGV